jgi:hypothetical protein
MEGSRKKMAATVSLALQNETPSYFLAAAVSRWVRVKKKAGGIGHSGAGPAAYRR